jgi:hypothetical protein
MLLYFLSSPKIIPNRFHSDSNTIRRFIASSGMVFSGDSSYQSTASFYRLIGFQADSPHVVEASMAFVSFTIFLFFVFFIIKINMNNFFSIVLLIFEIFVFGAYFSFVSKDLIPFTLLTVSYLFYKKSKFYIFYLSAILVYAIFFRHYWFLALSILVFFLVINKFREIKVRLFITISFFIQIVSSVGYFILTHEFISKIKEGANADRIGSIFAKTIINNWIPTTNLLTDIVNNAYCLINLIIPLDGLASVNEIVYYVWLYTVLATIFVAKFKFKIDILEGNLKYIIFFFFSFLLIQSFFEPDIGSAFRHQLVVSIPIPLLMTQKIESSLKDIKENEKISLSSKII